MLIPREQAKGAVVPNAVQSLTEHRHRQLDVLGENLYITSRWCALSSTDTMVI